MIKETDGQIVACHPSRTAARAHQAALYASESMNTGKRAEHMEHVLLKAATQAATDEGLFEAVISSATVDREKDVVSPEGMVRALRAWASSGKRIPLAWNHSTDAANQIGYVDPASVRAVGDEVLANGWIDQSTDVGREAWRLVKMGTLGFSFGYMITKASPRAGGGRNLEELDVFEITATPLPVNPDTRVVSWKAEKQTDQPPTVQQRRILQSMLEQAREYAGLDPDSEDAAEMRRIVNILQELAGEPGSERDESGGEGKVVSRRDARKATWTAQLINDLPDSAFLYIEPGGEKDEQGKTTPRSLRHFPVRGPDGQLDEPHLRNALSRIPQSSLPQSVKDSATAKARRLLDNINKSVDVTGRKPARLRSVDPLRQQADAVALEIASGGESLKKRPRLKEMPKPAPVYELSELKRRSREEMLRVLSGE